MTICIISTKMHRETTTDVTWPSAVSIAVIYCVVMLSTSQLCAENTQQAYLLVLGPTMRRIQWVRVSFPEVKQLTTHLHLEQI